MIRVHMGVDYIPPKRRKRYRRKGLATVPRVQAVERVRLHPSAMGDASDVDVSAKLKTIAKKKALPICVTGPQLSAYISDVIRFGEQAAEMPLMSRVLGTAPGQTGLLRAIAEGKRLRDQIEIPWFGKGPDYCRGFKLYDDIMEAAKKIYIEGSGSTAAKAVIKKAKKTLKKDLSKPLDPDAAFRGAAASVWKAHRVKILVGGGVVGALLLAPYIAGLLKGARTVRAITRG